MGGMSGMRISLPKRLILFLLVLSWVLLLPLTALAADTYKTTGRVNFRTGPSTSYEVITTLDTGTAVMVETYDPNGWSKATVYGATGYIKSEYIVKETSQTQTAGSEADQPAAYRTTGRVNFRYGPSTDAGVIRVLDAGTSVTVSNYDPDGWSAVSHNGTDGYIKSEYLAEAASYGSVSPADVELTPWSEAKSIMTTYTPAMVTDVRTGSVYWIQSFSNGSHADVEPLTKADTEIMYNTFGRKWSWAVRPVWVTINGHTMDASINGMPHGGGVIADNGMDGQICLHFKGSNVHNGNASFARTHQNGVMEAWNTAQAMCGQ